MENTLKLIIKNVYGNELVYPACNTSELLAAFKGTKTFNDADLNRLQMMGYKFDWVATTRRFA